MKSIFGDLQEYFSYIQPEVLAVPTLQFPTSSTGYLEKSDTQDEDYFIRIQINKKGELEVNNLRSSQNIQLRVTVGISLVLAILLTLTAVAASVVLMINAFKKLAQKSQQFRIYTYNHLKEEGLLSLEPDHCNQKEKTQNKKKKSITTSYFNLKDDTRVELTAEMKELEAKHN